MVPSSHALVLWSQSLLSRKSLGSFAHRIPAAHAGIVVDDADLRGAVDSRAGDRTDISGGGAGGGAMVAAGTGVSAVLAVSGTRGYAKEVREEFALCTVLFMQ